MKDDTNTTLTFEDVNVKVGSNSAKNNGKKFEYLSIEVTSKEIYIGSNFKVKWKHVKDLKIYTGKINNDVNDNVNDNDKKKKEEDVVYVDNDDGPIGFKLRCFNNKNGKSKKKTDHFRSVFLSRRNENNNYSDDEEDEEEDIRVFDVKFPIAPPGHRDFVASWDEFHGILKRFYDKEFKKRKNKLEREEEERQQELKEQKQNKSSSSYASRRGGGRRTYSKRTTKFDKFMLKNKANIENNAAIWSDDDDEEADADGNNYEINNDDTIDDTNQSFKNNKSRERFEEGVEEANTLWKGQNNDNNDDDISVKVAENHDNHDDDDDDDDDDEHEFNDDNDNVGIYGGDDDATAVGDDDDDDEPILKRKDTTEAKEKESTKKEEKEDNKNDDDDSDDSVNNNRSTKPVRKRLKKKKIVTASKKRRGPVLDDSEDDDEDDDEFTFKDESNMMTTPAAAIQRIVSPTTTGMKKLQQQKKKQQQKPPRIVQEEDEENTTNKEQANRKKQRNAGDESESQKTKNISSFFQPKSKPKTTTVTSATTTTNSLLDKNNKECIIESATTDSATTNAPTKKNDDDETIENSDVEMDGKNHTKESAEDTIMGDDDNDVLMDSDHEVMQVVTKNNNSNRKRGSKADSANKFFSPQKRIRKQKTIDVDRPSDNSITTSNSSKTSSDDETSTVIGATTQEDIIDVDDGSDRKSSSTKFPRYTPEQNRRLKLAIRNSERRVEDDDPIEEVDSSQSQSPSRPNYSSSKRTTTISSSLFPRKSSSKRLKYGSGGGTALKALELADARTRNTTPLKLHSRPHDVETNGSSSLSPVRKRLDMGTMSQVQKQHVNSSKWRGLKNYGNSCYVNSSLQQLFSIPLFIESISKNKEGHELVTTLSNLWMSMNPMGKTDQNTLGAASARDVKVVMDKLTDRFKGSQQRDSHEFLGELIDRIHDELSGNEENDASSSVDSNVMPSSTASANNDKNGIKLSQDEIVEPVDEFFRWNVQVCLECKSCGYSRSKEEMYRYLSIDVGDGNFNLRDPNFIQPKVDLCLKRFFSAEDREVNCEKCEEGKIATQTMKILSKPKVILLHLKRFFVAERQITEKDNSTSTEIVLKKNKVPVELTTKLSIDKLLANESIETSLPSNEYSLKSIVYHIGNTANSGHYTTDALRKDLDTGKDQWVSYDDGVTVEKSIEGVVQQTKNQKTAYMLMYSVD
jgi:ubiquitin C-terminal hydrolase